ncbi:MAG TPA: hypothetical protein VGL97_23895 [Bryobacteraceae bacterium]|jgi:hypothetical protein
MPSKSGSVYGLTILSPIIDDPHAEISHDLQLRIYLGGLKRDERSPFAKVTGTHIARLCVLNDVVFVGSPSKEEHLKSQYLVFESNFDGDLDPYLRTMATQIPEHVDAVWSHCVGYPGVQNVEAFQAYMKRCQLDTTFFFADVNDKTVGQALRALQTQAAVAAFIESNQGRPAAEIQQAFGALLEALKSAPTPVAGSGLTGPQSYQMAIVGRTTHHE